MTNSFKELTDETLTLLNHFLNENSSEEDMQVVKNIQENMKSLEERYQSSQSELNSMKDKVIESIKWSGSTKQPEELTPQPRSLDEIIQDVANKRK